jgi:Flp pilus assembly protein TadG
MRQFHNLLKRFRSDERGVFAVFFGLLAIVLIATAGATVDFTRLEQARTRAQDALDSAALGLQPQIFETGTTVDTIRPQAQLLLTERLATDVTGTITSVEIDEADGQLVLAAEINVPMSFVSLVGVNNINARVLSEATRKRLNVEVAMVLDNSGSMASSSRMTRLKEAAKSATDILFDNQTSLPNVYISIIPFTQYVNVGATNRTASWMSQTGDSSVSELNFDHSANALGVRAPVDRWALYDGFNNESWSGCVEARVAPYDANDVEPDSSVPDTMFQPVFAPDAWGHSYITDNPAVCSARGSCTWVMTKTGCNNGGSSCSSETNNTTTMTATYIDRNGVTLTSSRQQISTGTPVTPDACTCDALPLETDPANRIVGGAAPGTTVQTGSGTNRTRVTTRRCNYTFDVSAAYGNLSQVQLAERICKYKGASFSGDGPNSDCPTTEILPLNNVRQTVKDRIDAMVAEGSTNIQQGTIWGLHSLSPTEPLSTGRTYEEATYKVMIVMTDGENNPNYAAYAAGSGSGYYGNTAWTAWGYRINHRLLTEATTPQDSTATESQYIGEVDRRTKLACASAKSAGITVYAIGLAAASGLQQMLKDCSSGTGFWYFPTTAAQLVTVFETIAAQLADLRLAR